MIRLLRNSRFNLHQVIVRRLLSSLPCLSVKFHHSASYPMAMATTDVSLSTPNLNFLCSSLPNYSFLCDLSGSTIPRLVNFFTPPADIFLSPDYRPQVQNGQGSLKTDLQLPQATLYFFESDPQEFQMCPRLLQPARTIGTTCSNDSHHKPLEIKDICNVFLRVLDSTAEGWCDKKTVSINPRQGLRSISQGTATLLLQIWMIQNMVACEKIVTPVGGKLNTSSKIKNEV